MSPIESENEDPTRKQRREQARSERRALEESTAASAARRKRLAQLGSIAAVVIIAVVIIAVATGSGKSAAPPKANSKEATKTSAAVTALLAGIPQSGNALGNPTAPVTLDYFGDLECPFCKELTIHVLPKLIAKYVRAGKLRIEYHSMETATREPEVFKTQQVAALAAGKQAKMWNFIETFYHEQGDEQTGYVTENYLQGLAKQIPGLNLAQWMSARSEPPLANELTTDAQTANNEGFTGTPAFLLGKSGGKLSKYESSSFTDPSGFEEAITKALKA